VTERQYQTKLIRKIRRRFPGCVVLKNDSAYLQGIPDWLILFGPYWAMLEMKDSLTSNKQPNQEYYVKTFNEMSFGAFICPENEEEILDALQEAFESHRRACVPQS
jgi:hypothetical protein